MIDRELFHACFACPACARGVAKVLQSTLGVSQASVDYRAQLVRVSYRPDTTSRGAIQELISRSAFGCSCQAADLMGHIVGGELPALAHRADMAAVTMGTTTDRMQYEFGATAAGKVHEHHAAEHKAHAPHGGMAHDMSDPIMAKAMERDMRNRFFVALLLTIPTLLFSPLAMNTLGIRLVPLVVANWIMLLLSTPVRRRRVYPRFGLMLQPEWSALLMSLSSIIVATNAVLLKRVEGELEAIH
jgi:P-type Cu2+ transporter